MKLIHVKDDFLDYYRDIKENKWYGEYKLLKNGKPFVHGYCENNIGDGERLAYDKTYSY